MAADRRRGGLRHVQPPGKPPQREQLDLFRALPGDMAPRDSQDLMAFRSSRLSRGARRRSTSAGNVTIRVEGTQEHGIATIWDADVLIWAASQIVEARDAGLRPSRWIRATPYEILRFIGRGTSLNDYQRLKAALDRLQSTTVATSIRETTGRRLHRSWINEWKELADASGTPLGIELILPDWFSGCRTTTPSWIPCAARGTGITAGEPVWTRAIRSTGYRAIRSTTLVHQEYENAGKPTTARVCVPSNLPNKKYITLVEARRFGGQPRNGTARPAFQLGGPRHDLRVFNQKGGVGKTTPPRTSPANWRCAACMSSCWMPTRRGHRSTGRSGVASRACPVCSAPWACPRNAASGSARTRQAGRSHHHRRPAAHRRPRAFRAAGGRARADPAAQPLRLGFAEMVALIREAQCSGQLRAAFVINRRVSTTIIGREARQSLAEQLPRCARRSTSASSLPTA